MKKCLVLDLDNTLWGGVIGEDGMQGISLALTPPGNSFLAFQQAIMDLRDRGIILTVNSRNNPADALAVIRTHPNMILKEPHFSAMRINWDDKVENVKSLAKELNIGLDSMVFLDDDKTNRAQMRSMLPEVTTPELPADPAEYARFLHSLPYFEGGTITDEDKMRGNFYVTERLRKDEESRATSKEDFLKGLGLELYVHKNAKPAISRLSQLTEKTNQFNVDKSPKTEAEVTALMESDDHEIYHARLLDKFGDYGIIAMAIVRKSADGTTWHLPTLLMSCRVFGRGVEDAFLSSIMDKAAAAGARHLTVTTRETEKNLPAREFVSRVFKNGTLDIDKAAERPQWIKINHADIQ